jgi:diacylglycerol kinase (ATP)
MTTVAVIAHRKKQLGAGLGDLRQALFDAGVTDPLWFEVNKGKKAPPRAKEACDAGADLVFVWGGDGTVQRCADALAGSDVPIAIVPAGTANLLATNLGVPRDIAACVKLGLHGARRRIDLGNLNGERFAVMAGVGFDALMIRDAGRGMKDHLGRLAYVVTGARHLGEEPTDARIDVDGERWFTGSIGCALVGNVGSLFGGITVFQDARPDDGRLQLGVVTADGGLQWMRALARTAAGSPERSPFVEMTTARRIDIRLARKLPYELDGGDRPPTKRVRVEVEPGAVTVCVPDDTTTGR